MNSGPSSRMAVRLAPALLSVARLVASDGIPADSQLYLLATASDADDLSAATDELQRWARLLEPLREGAPDGLRRTVIEALLLRGIPAAIARQAVEAVTAVGDKQDSAPESAH